MIIGITGGIGSGKSTIAKELAKQGFAVYDCDREAKRIIAEDSTVQQAITALLGKEAFQEVAGDNGQGTIRTYNTAYVAQRVFAEPELLAKLNAIIHPAVKRDIEQSAFSRQHSAILFVESAILYEAGLDALCDRIVIVDAPEEVRIARTIARDYQGEASPDTINKVRARMKSQLSAVSRQPSDKKTTVLLNDGTVSVAALAQQIISML